MAGPSVIAAASLEYVRVRLDAEEAGVQVDPTSLTVSMAFMVSGSPVSGDLKTASWEVDETTRPTTYYARCLVGPGGAVALKPGIYTVWVKVTDSPEVPLIPAGPLKVR